MGCPRGPPLRSPVPSVRVPSVALSERILPPSPVLLALEGRAWLEFAALVPALPLLARAPRGDGHPVLVLPGWLANDRSTWALRPFLRDRGYHVHGWRLGRNLGPDPGPVAGLGPRCPRPSRCGAATAAWGPIPARCW